MGLGEGKLRRLEEVLARAKTTDEAKEEFKKLSENPSDPQQRNNNIKIVKGEELVSHLENGWTKGINILILLQYPLYLIK